MDAVLAVAADYANASSDGKLNIMGIFQEITPAGFPAVVPQMYLVISWDAGPAEFGLQKSVRITFMGPDPSENVSVERQIVVPEAPLPGERAVFPQILDVKGLTVFRSGPHAIYVLVGDEEKARIPLYVREPPETDREEVAGNG